MEINRAPNEVIDKIYLREFFYWWQMISRVKDLLKEEKNEKFILSLFNILRTKMY